MNYAFHPEAEREFIETAARYEAEIPGLGLRFGAEVYRVVEILLENPKIGTPIGVELRHFVLRRFPHSIIYAEISDDRAPSVGPRVLAKKHPLTLRMKPIVLKVRYQPVVIKMLYY